MLIKACFFQTCEHMSVYFQEYGHAPACFRVCILSNMHKHVYMFWIRVCAIVYFGVCTHMLTCLNCVCTRSYVSEYVCIFPCVFGVCIHIVCTCLHMCACIHMFSGVSICLQVCECVHLSLYVFGGHFFHVCTYVHMFSGVSLYSYVYLCLCVFSVSICF